MTVGNVKINGLMLAGVIIIVSFVYALNIQPAVTADPGLIKYTELNNSDSYEKITNSLNENNKTIIKGSNNHRLKISNKIRLDLKSYKIAINSVGPFLLDASNNYDYANSIIQTLYIKDVHFKLLGYMIKMDIQGDLKQYNS
jgi:hypothetical protein